MNSHGGQFVLGVITAIAMLIAGLYFGIIPGYSHRFGPTLVIETISPDGQYVARSERISNNHGWCEERATVDRLGTRSDWEREYVFVNQCGMPVSMTWPGNKALKITYGYDELGKAQVSRHAFSRDGQITIDYQVATEGVQ